MLALLATTHGMLQTSRNFTVRGATAVVIRISFPLYNQTDLTTTESRSMSIVQQAIINDQKDEEEQQQQKKVQQ